MPDFTDQTSIYLVLALVVPGLIITYVRAQFITGRMQKHSDAVLSYFALSAVYGAIALPLVGWLKVPENWPHTLSWFLAIFVGPAVFGALLGWSTKTGAVRRLLNRVGIYPVHAMPTAWDWKFGDMGQHLVLIKLRDGKKFAGYCGKNSFMSSDPAERDIYVEKIYPLGEDDTWNDGGDHSLWVAHNEIQTIEFFPVSEKGERNA